MPKAKKASKKKASKPAKAKTSKTLKVAKVSKASKAKRLSRKDLDLFKRLLMDLRKKIVGDLSQIEGNSLNGDRCESPDELSDVGDKATDNYDRELNIGLASNEQQILNDVDVALKRIDEGTYGICELTGEAIPKKRLMVMPYTRLSKKAQEEEEKNKRRL
ncbi:MAG TPA: TraR/DksA C4-type zinc finger protein [Candidatus Omnitrophota bacterium]|nr:TraR/DksA C4-type zinc finger protein [Candidatus Omnitrophota bacterium]HPS37465.1 TraR/DksA C4-type zinc finger protein [Candidatus Omnitrophota bacterium]